MSAKCKPEGPYCVGLDAILDADVRRGAQVRTMYSIKTGRQTRTVITHEAIFDGKKRRMIFTFCPVCGGRLGAEPTPEQPPAAAETPGAQTGPAADSKQETP